MDVYDIIQFAVDNNKLYFVNALMNHPDINKLYVSIILNNNMDNIIETREFYDPRDNNHKSNFLAVQSGNSNNIDNIRQNLEYYDPRDDNHKAYFLAVQHNNPIVINMVKDNIIQRTLLEGEVFRRQTEYVGTGVAKDLYGYTRWGM